MADIIPNEGLMNLLDIAVAPHNALRLRLCKNNVTITPQSVLGDFTQCDFSGYAAISLEDFPDAEMSPGGKARSATAIKTFEHNGGPNANQAYAYYVTAEGSGTSKLLWAGRLDDAPVSMTESGDSVEIAITIQERQEI